MVFQRCLTPYRPQNATSRDPYPPPSSRDPPSGRDPSPLLRLFGKEQGARGPGSRGGSRLVAFSMWAVWPWECHEPGPANEPGPLASPEKLLRIGGGGYIEGLGRKMAHSSACLDTSRKCPFTGIYSINRASEWLWPETEEAPQNGQNVHGFRVRTPICHIAPVSRAYGGGGMGFQG